MIELWLVRIVSCDDSVQRAGGWKPGAFLKYQAGLSAVTLEDASVFAYREAAEAAVKKYSMYGLKMEVVHLQETV